MASYADLTTIAATDAFRQRVLFAMSKYAQSRFATAEAQERAHIQLVLKGNGPLSAWALAVATHSGIASGTHNLDGSTVTDAAIDTAVAAIWPAWVG